MAVDVAASAAATAVGNPLDVAAVDAAGPVDVADDDKVAVFDG
jgi:hypothetical protein